MRKKTLPLILQEDGRGVSIACRNATAMRTKVTSMASLQSIGYESYHRGAEFDIGNETSALKQFRISLLKNLGQQQQERRKLRRPT